MKPSLICTLLLASSTVFFSACKKEDIILQSGLPYASSFQSGSDGWAAQLAEFSPKQDTTMRFRAAWTSLPRPLNVNRRALLLSSMNRSDDAFMFLTKRITGLSPNATYSVTFKVELASKYGKDSFGIGGSPGSSVYLKAGAISTRPVITVVNDHYSLNIDKGNQSTTGKEVVELGNIGIDSQASDYQLITRTHPQPLLSRSNAQGELWLVIGSDSGYEGQTTLYYSQIDVAATLIK